MYRVHSHVHFNSRGDAVGCAVELLSESDGSLLSVAVSEAGPFDDFSDVYAATYQRAVEAISHEVAGQAPLFPQDHPRMLLRRATDLASAPPM